MLLAMQCYLFLVFSGFSKNGFNLCTLIFIVSFIWCFEIKGISPLFYFYNSLLIFSFVAFKLIFLI
jgi:hypothetical protein